MQAKRPEGGVFSMNVLFVNDSSSSSNWGDRAAAVSLMQMVAASGGAISHAITEEELRQGVFVEHPHYDAVPTTSRLQAAGRQLLPPLAKELIRRKAKNVGLSRAYRLIPRKWEEFAPKAKLVLQQSAAGWPRMLTRIEESDLIVIHGNGAMIGHGTVPCMQLFIAYIAKSYFRKPVIIVNHSVDFEDPVLRKMSQELYPLFDDVVFRDPISLDRCKNLCEGRYAADSAFWFRPAPRDDWFRIADRLTYFDVWPDTARLDIEAPYLCLGGSSVFSNECSTSYIVEEYVSLIEHLKTIYSGQIVLTVSGLTELEIFRPLSFRLGLPLISPIIPVQQAVDLVGHADAYMGGRWHTAIFALSGGVPVVPFSAKQSKMTALMQSACLPSDSFDAFSLRAQRIEIGSRLIEYLEQGSVIRRRLAAWSEEARASSWGNVSFLERGANE